MHGTGLTCRLANTKVAETTAKFSIGYPGMRDTSVLACELSHMWC